MINPKALATLALTACLAACAADERRTAGPTSRPTGLRDDARVLRTDTPYFLTGPQQSRGADGTLAKGTRVRVLKDSGSYTLVVSDGLVEAYVATDVLTNDGDGR